MERREFHFGKGMIKRKDFNNDGQVGPAERNKAKHVHDHVDKNNDGKVGPLERDRAKAKRSSLPSPRK